MLWPEDGSWKCRENEAPFDIGEGKCVHQGCTVPAGLDRKQWNEGEIKDRCANKALPMAVARFTSGTDKEDGLSGQSLLTDAGKAEVCGGVSHVDVITTCTCEGNGKVLTLPAPECKYKCSGVEGDLFSADFFAPYDGRIDFSLHLDFVLRFT